MAHLHGFCDASSKAYAAVIYGNTIDVSGTSRTVSAKMKVAGVGYKMSLPTLMEENE